MSFAFGFGIIQSGQNKCMVPQALSCTMILLTLRSRCNSKGAGLVSLLDLHYSDTWADPGKQEIPAAWKDIKDINVLKDSVYNYTNKIFQYFGDEALIPELVQIGNETNCGMLYTNATAGFPLVMFVTVNGNGWASSLIALSKP